jgi:hypothetical protein
MLRPSSAHPRATAQQPGDLILLFFRKKEPWFDFPSLIHVLYFGTFDMLSAALRSARRSSPTNLVTKKTHLFCRAFILSSGELSRLFAFHPLLFEALWSQKGHPRSSDSFWSPD